MTVPVNARTADLPLETGVRSRVDRELLVSGRRNQGSRSWLVFVVLLVVIGLAWELAGATSGTVALLISRPSLVFKYLLANHEMLIGALATTAFEATVGLLLAIFVALAFAAILVYRPALADTVYPFLVASQVIPFVCLAPLMILLFGFGSAGKVFLSALMTFFPVLTNIVAGVRSLPRSHLELMTIFAAPRSVVMRHVVVPFTLWHFFAGLRIAAPFAVVGAIVAEFNGAAAGLGRNIFMAAKRLEPELMMTSIIAGALLSGAIYGLILLAERLLGEWYWEN